MCAQPIDVPQRLTATRQRRKRGKELRSELRSALGDGSAAALWRRRRGDTAARPQLSGWLTEQRMPRQPNLSTTLT